MRTLTKVLSVIAIVALCLCANVSKVAAAGNGQNDMNCDYEGDAPVVMITCTPGGGLNADQSCDFNENKKCELLFSAPTLEWGYTAENREDGDVTIAQAKTVECEPDKVVLPPGITPDVTYTCSEPVSELRLCLEQTSNVIVTDLRCDL